MYHYVEEKSYLKKQKNKTSCLPSGPSTISAHTKQAAYPQVPVRFQLSDSTIPKLLQRMIERTKERFPYYLHIVTNQNLARQWLRSLFNDSFWRDQMIGWHPVAPSWRNSKPNNQLSRSEKHNLSIKYQYGRQTLRICVYYEIYHIADAQIGKIYKNNSHK